MFQITCKPSSGSRELCLTEVTRGGSQIFFMCLVSVWQRNFEITCGGSQIILNPRCVRAGGTMGWELVPSPSYCAHTPQVQNYL